MRLLLAEDEKSLSKAIVTILKKNNYEVDAAYNGLDALDDLEAGEYDGAILDIMMPGMDGVTVLKKLRSRGSKLPVLFLTAKSEIDDKVTGLNAGANDYLTKPFAVPELLARIRAMTRTQSEQTSAILSFGNIELNQKTYELSSPSGSYKLANKEFQMLELLMRHPHQIISAEQFLDRIWGYETESDINVVWVYISYLRKKLGALHADIQIRASRGAGYSIEKLD